MIKQLWLFVISMLLLIACLWFVVDRFIFLQTAARTTGQVMGISSSNTRCGGGKHRSSYPCTKFTATIGFVAAPVGRYKFTISAGSKRGYDYDISGATYRQGQNVPVVFDPKNPDKAYEDSFFGVWAMPVITGFFQVITLLSSFFQPRQRRRYIY